MKKTILLSAALVASLGASELPEYEVAPHFTKALTEGNSKIDDYNMLGLTLSKKIAEDWMLSLTYAKGDTDYKKSSVDTDIEIGMLNAEYYFYKQDNLYAFATAGAGYQHFDTKFNGRDSGAKFNYGAGVKYYFNDVVNVFAKATHLTDFSDDENELHISAGLGFAFGKSTPQKEKTSTLVEQVQKQRAQAPQKRVDSDGDFVYDAFDKCPNTPQGSLVDKNGCALDSDSDGVIDLYDACANTPQGFSVDENGCALSYDFQVHFAFDSSILSAKAHERIDAFAAFIKSNDDAIKQVEIAGHTDAKGSNEYNLWLSERRAKAVYDKLVDKGISQKLMIYKGYGEDKPLVSNDTEENRALNRRVEGNIVRK
jgi:OOP family OmpA-OmpF porin